MISFSCTKCGKPFNLKPEFAGRKTNCSGCKEPLVVPMAEATLAAAALPKIAFSCQTCGMKFNVLAEFAGRATNCPTCKTPLHVPAPNETLAFVPAAGKVNGAPSSLAGAGIDAGVTLGGPHTGAGRATPLSQLLDSKDGSDRYVIEEPIARGGMGAIMRAVDCDIRREVAIKYLLDQSSETNKKRFVEEAQITGQLEHPNIVPIHEISIDGDDRVFFSMKLVHGRSLQEILKGLVDNPGSATEFSQSRLLNIFVNVCNALDYAHTRGVVHRDLKPANIMVGDFGEVYVMDWGLAKVLKPATDAVPLAAPVTQAALAHPLDFTPQPFALATPVAKDATPSSSGSQVVTSRDDTDFTKVGSIIGTPVYMPPEQADGRVHEIDQRSDIYSMGAILYEILTLQAPIDREGGVVAIIERVRLNQIVKPERRAPELARAGKIPAALAAIAMKALKARPTDRYQKIAELREDVERFLDGRSVSARPDTPREMIVKLVQRHKGVAIAVAAALTLLFFVIIASFIAILIANRRTQRAYDAYVVEQKEKQLQAKRSVPALVRSARVLIGERNFAEALNQMNTAIGFDETEPEARLVRAQLLLHKLDFDAARKDLEVSVKQRRNFHEAEALLEIARDGKPDHLPTLLPLTKELIAQRVPELAEPLTHRAQKLMGTQAEMVQVYQVKIEAAWPGMGTQLSVDKVGQYALDLPSRFAPPDLEPLRGIPLGRLAVHSGIQISDLAPLKGMPLTSLHLSGSARVTDVTPLEGMKLTHLILINSGVRDLRPLKGMPLRVIDLNGCGQISDLAPLQDMRLTSLNLVRCVGVTSLTPLAGMPLTSLEMLNGPRLHDLTPLKGMQLKSLHINGTPDVRDLAPLTGMPLTALQLHHCPNLTDLSVLKNMPLQTMMCNECPKADLTPLSGNTKLASLEIQNHAGLKDLTALKQTGLMSLGIHQCFNLKSLAGLEGLPLVNVRLFRCGVEDLGPLRGLSLTQLNCNEVPIKDLEPLRNMPLKGLQVKHSKVSDLTPLSGMKLETLDLDNSAVADLTPLKGLPLRTLTLQNCKAVTDLSPLAGMTLVGINFPPTAEKVDALREMKTLIGINGLPPVQFWKLWDAPKKK